MLRYTGDLQHDLATVSRDGLADEIVGGLSKPSKMPGFAWGIPTTRCKIGSILAQQTNSTCSHCYASKGRYNFARVQNKMQQRYEGLQHPLWVPAMIFVIRWNVERFFRWFDSGDLQSTEHLQNILFIAEQTSEILHWLPTREYDILRTNTHPIPDNVTIRVSANFIDEPPPTWWPQTSTVVTSDNTVEDHQCPAPKQNNFCGSCRACWQRDVRNVSYQLH